MRIVACLPDALLRHVRSAVLGRHVVVATSTLPALEALLVRRNVDALLIDPVGVPGINVSVLIPLAARYPHIPVVTYTALSAQGTRAAIELADAGLRHLVLAGCDDHPELLRQRIQELPALAMGEQLVATLRPSIGMLPPGIAEAVVRLFRAPGSITGVRELVRVAGVPRRTFDRALRRAGMASARHLIQCGNLLPAYVLIRHGTLGADAIALQMGSSSPQRYWQTARRVTGFGFEALRHRLEPEAFVAQLAARMRRPDRDASRDASSLDGAPPRRRRIAGAGVPARADASG